jgi:hypothetical protein
MKQLHRPDLFGWSCFDEARNIDFHSVLWLRPEGNVAIDPLPQSPHDARHCQALGGVSLIVVTNSDHVRAAEVLAGAYAAPIAGPRAERDRFPIACQRWLGDGDEPVPGLLVYELHGSKTPGELALLLDRTSLITGDLVRGHSGGALNLLPDAKLADKAAATRSVARLAAIAGVQAVLVGDGWPVFRDGSRLLAELSASLAP